MYIVFRYRVITIQSISSYLKIIVLNYKTLKYE